MKEPKVLTRMRLCERWGNGLNSEELKEVNNYIKNLENENEELKNQLEKAKSKLTTMFANENDDKVLDDLLELGKILEVE